MNNKEKFLERIPTSVRFSRDERKRIWALTPNLSEYVKQAALKQLEADERECAHPIYDIVAPFKEGFEPLDFSKKLKDGDVVILRNGNYAIKRSK